MPTGLFILALIIVPVISAAVADATGLVIGFVAVLVANPIVRAYRKRKYFGSEEFAQLRQEVSALVAEHNEVAEYVTEISEQGSFDLGRSRTGQHAHLASSQNTSQWNYRRDRNVVEIAPHVHNASLQVVRNASVEPLKYLMKYFSIKADQATLADVQRVSADFARLEAAIDNIRRRERELLGKIDPPKFIRKHYSAEFWEQIGVHLSPINVPYPRYKFQYVSAGGNSGQTVNITLDPATLEALAEVLVDKIRWTKSAAGQRALMTRRLRTWIKDRDGHACQTCGVSVADEPNLLLEVDHIIPVSRGGLSIPENLQTLCWRCNRTKGSKMPA